MIMNATVILETGTVETASSDGYLIGILIAFFILGYLFYSLAKPGKF